MQLQLSDKKFERGTLITVQFKKPESISYSATGVTNRYLETELDSCYENNSIEQIREEYITLLHDYYEAMSNTVAGMSEPGTSEKK